MKNMTLDNIANAINGKLCGENIPTTPAQGVVIDNRLVEDGYIFIAIKGNRVDGHTLVNKAFESGALAAIVEQDGDYNGPYIVVDSTPKALANVATYYRSQLDIPIVGIIGSVGKTSTKEMTASVLSQKFNVLKTAGNFNNEVGLPLTLLSIKEEHTAAVVEMGISDFGEMKILGAIARPDIVVFTCIGECHLENLGDRDGVLKAKTEVFDYLSDNATVIINASDDKLATITKESLPEGTNLVSYSGQVEDVDNMATYQAVKVTSLGLEGMKVEYAGKESGEVTVPLPGEHNVGNALAAMAAGFTLGESKSQIAEGIASAATIAGRSNFIKVNDITIIDDCYNANPMSMRAGLGILGMTDGRRIAVLGDMGELGEDELNLHRQLYQSVIDNNIDVIFTAGDLSSSIVDALHNEPEAKNIVAKS
nr:UDP-N-acetylmuramoyl-tripeptide--D-alanyl-D-alanine ligase [Lachnospiraceae bacterium]